MTWDWSTVCCVWDLLFSWLFVWTSGGFYLLVFMPFGVMREKASWLPAECRSTGVFLIKRKTGSHYSASVLSSLLIVRDGNRGFTEPHCSDWMRHESVCHQKKAITLQISHVMEDTGHNILSQGSRVVCLFLHNTHSDKKHRRKEWISVFMWHLAMVANISLDNSFGMVCVSSAC